MYILRFIINSVEFVIFSYLLFITLYILLYSVAGVFKRKKKFIETSNTSKYAVMIPGYKEDAVIIDVAKKALEQSYPKDNYDVIVIADSFNENTLAELKKLPIKLVEVSFEVSTKAKALNKTMSIIGDHYDFALILDADNVMETDFIKKIDTALTNGYDAVQGRRIEKNVNTSFAILDAISEEVNNHIFRKGFRALNMSSSLSGSAMAFNYKLFKEIMATIDSVGEDKELEMKLLTKKKKIEFIQDAFVYDEKTQKSDAFYNQRRRWVSAQLVYLKRYFFPGIKALFAEGNVDYFNKAVHYLILPRVITLGLLFCITLLYGIFSVFNLSIIGLSFTLWAELFFFNLMAIIIAIPRKFYNKKTLLAFKSLPNAIFLLAKAIFKMKGADKKFIHTTHGVD